MKTISIKWSTEDILAQAESMEVTLTEEEAETVLENVEKYHDATVGINWDVISCHIDDFLFKQKNK